ncbi:hypothetical protein IFR04_013143 [Cadophora malorum]|uniref:Uncharacterized protein n=1 Tax=Cadophora malorum TaxID=108018 RepID=A0A8H7T7E6_9HELO|nr:hypothetical protein IFR04_013143 [Cadophora malorum]
MASKKSRRKAKKVKSSDLARSQKHKNQHEPQEEEEAEWVEQNMDDDAPNPEADRRCKSVADMEGNRENGSTKGVGRNHPLQKNGSNSYLLDSKSLGGSKAVQPHFDALDELEILAVGWLRLAAEGKLSSLEEQFGIYIEPEEFESIGERLRLVMRSQKASRGFQSGFMRD